ncbi:hypothetical protein C8R44DRAFT_876754 [Mycena epipterygia]|nr:hypothetical protein C8R44DRAFT_876754 [Mycena epipterygia]
MLSLALHDAMVKHRPSFLIQIGSSRKARKRAAILDVKAIDVPGLTPSSMMERIMGWLLDSSATGVSQAVGLLLAITGFVRYWEEFRAAFWASPHDFVSVAMKHLEAALRYTTAGGDPRASQFFLPVLVSADFFIPCLLEFPVEGGALLNNFLPRLATISPGLLIVLDAYNLPFPNAISWLRLLDVQSRADGPDTIVRGVGLMRLVRVNTYKCRYSVCRHVPPNPISVCSGCRVFRYCRQECLASAWKAGHALVCRQLAQLRTQLGLSAVDWDTMLRSPDGQGLSRFVYLCEHQQYPPEQMECISEALEIALREMCQDVATGVDVWGAAAETAIKSTRVRF